MLHTATPPARKSCHSFAHCVPFHSFHFQGICLFPPTNPCGCSRVPFHSTPLHHRTHTPFSFIRFNTLHSFITSSPCFFQRTVRAKKCAKPAAGSTRPPRSALLVSGALAPLAAARTQRTGFILRSVSLHSHFSLAIHAGSRLFFLFRFKPASPTPTPDHPPLRELQLMFNSECNLCLMFSWMLFYPTFSLQQQFFFSVPYSTVNPIIDFTLLKIQPFPTLIIREFF